MKMSVSWSPMSQQGAVTTPHDPVTLSYRLEKCKSNIKTFFLWLMKLQRPTHPPPSTFLSTSIIKHAFKKNTVARIVVNKGIWANIMQVCICMAGMVSAWVIVWVNRESVRGCLLTFLESEKVKHVCVNGAGEAPHPCWLSHTLETDW